MRLDHSRQYLRKAKHLWTAEWEAGVPLPLLPVQAFQYQTKPLSHFTSLLSHLYRCLHWQRKFFLALIQSICVVIQITKIHFEQTCLRFTADAQGQLSINPESTNGQWLWGQKLTKSNIANECETRTSLIDDVAKHRLTSKANLAHTLRYLPGCNPIDGSCQSQTGPNTQA